MPMQYDVAVIGGGPGGYVAALRCAQLGQKTVLIEKKQLGGTCLNRGCIPTKALLHSAEVYHTVAHAADFGVLASLSGFDYAKMAARKEGVVAKLRGGIQYLLKEAGVTIVIGEGILKTKNTIIVNDNEEIHARKIILASGSKPAALPIKGLELPGVLDSDGVLSLTQCPESVVIIGGGVIGIEFATLFNALGKKVTVIEMLTGILPGVEVEISALMHTLLQKKGIEIHTGAKVLSIEGGDCLTCHFEEKGQIGAVQGAVCVVAVGRKPDTEALGLSAIGVELNRGFIMVDDTMRTNIENLYAIGDSTGKIQLAHVASTQGLVAAHNAAGQHKKMDYAVVPACIYTSPEIAWVGLTEKEARDKGYEIQIGRFSAAGNGKCMVMGEKEGLVKLITDKRTGEILGAHIMAPRATDMIGEICAAMKAEATIEELSDTIHPHPSVSEMILEAAHDAEGLCCHQPSKKQ